MCKFYNYHYTKRQGWGDLGIIQVIDDGFFVCKCKVFSYMTKTTTSHAFVYDSNFSQEYIGECCGSFIDNISYAPICVLEENIER